MKSSNLFKGLFSMVALLILFSPVQAMDVDYICPIAYQVQARDRLGNLIRSTSGFTYPGESWMVTTLHSVRDAHSIRTVDSFGKKTSYQWKILEDRDNDIAVMSQTRPGKALKKRVSEILASAVNQENDFDDSIQLRSWIPSLGLIHVSGKNLGLTSVLNRKVIEINTPLTPGMSGGAVIDRQCKLIGVISFGIEGQQTRYFATPAQALKQSIQLKTTPQQLDG